MYAVRLKASSDQTKANIVDGEISYLNTN